MATVHFYNAYLWINGVDMSAMCSEIALTYGAELLDETAFGDTTRINKGGLYNWSLGLTFHQEFGAALVDGLLFPLVGTTTCFEVRPVNSCSTAINPRFFGVGILSDYPPMSGQVGTLLDVKATIASASNLTRSTTAT